MLTHFIYPRAPSETANRGS